MSNTARPGSAAVATGVDDARLVGLRRWNLALTVLHAAQAVAVLLLASSFAITVTSSFPAGPPGTAVPAPEPLFDVGVGAAIAVFLGLAALDHLLTATVLRRRYEDDLRARHQPVPLAGVLDQLDRHGVADRAYSGITGLSALIGIAGANVAMILFGWLQERMNPPGRTRRRCCRSGSATSPGPRRGWRSPPTSSGPRRCPASSTGSSCRSSCFFISFARQPVAAVPGIGRWRDYAYGEKAYLVLSLVAKSLLAWQIFAGSLAT